MKILFLATELFQRTGGIQIFNNFLVKALAEKGNALGIVSMNDKERFPIICDSFYPSGKSKLTFIIHSLKQLFFFRPELIICGHTHFSFFCRILRKIFGAPYFTIAHGIETWNLRGLKLSGIKHSNKIVSVSRFTKNRILEQIPGYGEDNIFILPDTFDAERFKPGPKPQYLKEKFKLQPDEKVVLTVARLSRKEKYKGYDKVIMAIKEIIKEIPRIKYIIGGAGDDENRIRSLIKDNDLEDRVSLAGFIPHETVVDYYNLCDCFVMPSKGEGFGIVFLEALACGKPVIAGDRDASREALLGGKLGLLVNPDKPKQIASAILKVLRREVDGQLLDADFLRRTAIGHFSFENFSHKVSEIVGSLGRIE